MPSGRCKKLKKKTCVDTKERAMLLTSVMCIYHRAAVKRETCNVVCVAQCLHQMC